MLSEILLASTLAAPQVSVGVDVDAAPDKVYPVVYPSHQPVIQREARQWEAPRSEWACVMDHGQWVCKLKDLDVDEQQYHERHGRLERHGRIVDDAREWEHRGERDNPWQWDERVGTWVYVEVRR